MLRLLRSSRIDGWTLPGFLFALTASLSGAPASAQMVIDSLIVTSGPAYSAGAFTDYFIDPEIQGSGIASIEFSTQSGLSVDLVQDANGIWECDEVIPTGPCENFASLVTINGFGDLTFSFLGTLGEVDTIVVPDADYDPGSGRAGFPAITAPSPGETGVPLDPSFTWNAGPAWVGGILAAVELAATGETLGEQFFPPGVTSWLPTGLLPGRVTDFRVSFFDVYFLDDPRTSSGARPYLFSSGFESFNFVRVTTVPPSVPIPPWAGGLVSLGLAGAGYLAARRRLAGRRH